MNREETLAIMGVLKTAYPAFYRDMNREAALQAVSLWNEMFRDDDAAVVAAAVKALIKTRVEGYPPTIGAVAEKIHELTKPQELTEGEAWGMVEKACRNGIYGYQEEFAALPPVVQKAVGSANQLREWAILDAGELKTVVASNFMRSFRAIQKREKEVAMIPADVRTLLQGVSERLALK